MEIKHKDAYFPTDFRDGLDTELDSIGIILNNLIICGECMIEMTTKNEITFYCKKCKNSIKISKN